MPYKIPSYHTYDNYRELAPELVKHEERLARAGLKDPWIRLSFRAFFGHIGLPIVFLQYPVSFAVKQIVLIALRKTFLHFVKNKIL